MKPKRQVETIYVYLPDEALDVWRPVKAEKLDEGVYRIIEQEYPEDEKWEFEPGEIVLCKYKRLYEGETLVAWKRG